MTPQKFCFRYDGSDEADKALEIIKKKFNRPEYDGVEGVCYHNDCPDNWMEPIRDYTLVPPAEFIRLMKGEEWRPKWGDKIECSDSGENWLLGYYCCPNPNPEFKDAYPHITNLVLGKHGGGGAYKYIRPIRKSLREEILGLLQSYETPKPEIADRIIQLIKERRL